MANNWGSVGGPAAAFEGLAVIAVDGAVISVVTANNTLGVDGAAAAGTATDVSISAANTEADVGLSGIGSRYHCDENGGEACKQLFHGCFLSVGVRKLGPGEREMYSR